MTVLPTPRGAQGERPGRPEPLTPGQRLGAFITTSALLAVTAVVTRSAESVVAVASSELLLLGWLGSGRLAGVPQDRDQP